MQSAYGKFHSNKTALLKLFNDDACSIDVGEEVALVLLDLSSAFDTIDHICLINRLERRFGISAKVLAWIELYFTQREQVVSINGASSKSYPMKWGVPQGSVLGTLLFIRYISPIENIIDSHGLYGHIYADDTQIYICLSVFSHPNVLRC